MLLVGDAFVTARQESLMGALFQFDPSNFVLSSFLRFPGGAASGDPEVIERVRHMFFRI